VRGLGQALDRLGHQLRDGAEGGYSSQMLRLEVGEQRRALPGIVDRVGSHE